MQAIRGGRDVVQWRRRTHMPLVLRLMALAVLACSSAGDGDEAALARAREAMVVSQIAARGVRDPKTLAALREVPRHLFVPRESRAQAYDDHPIPIGHGQTISQPYIVAFMTEAVGLRGGEIVAPLAEASAALLKSLGYANVSVRAGDGYQGWPEAAPFDAILVTAAAPRIPEPLEQHLKYGGDRKNTH